jgi:cap1 methyltransferase
MSVFKIPNNIIYLDESHLKLEFSTEEQNSFINNSLSFYLKNIKDKIDDKPFEWNSHKKFTNIYEFIHTNISNNSCSISKIKPISRAFYKLIEIIYKFNILKPYDSNSIKSFHFAEGPGGFMEAISYFRHNRKDKYYGITLIDSINKNVPTWKKSNIMNFDNNFIFENGHDNTGNLYNPKNYKSILNKYYNSFDFVTGDGGIDFSNNFHKQELIAFKLIFCEIFYAITVLKKNGSFVLKIFDIFHKPTIQCIYLLSTLFKDVYIFKPNTSRSGNSEKYVICKYFNDTHRDKLIQKFEKVLQVYNNVDETKFFIKSFLNIPMQHIFISKIQDINIILGNKQIKNILTTLKLIDNNEKKSDKIKTYKNENIQKCINWCIKHNIPYNNKAKPNNIFLENRIL